MKHLILLILLCVGVSGLAFSQHDHKHDPKPSSKDTTKKVSQKPAVKDSTTRKAIVPVKDTMKTSRDSTLR